LRKRLAVAKVSYAMNDQSNPGMVVLANSEATSACWSCGEMRAAHFCTSCGKVQPPAPVDHFAFFGLPRKLALDTGQLERDYYDMSRKLHPDLYSTANAREQEWSLEQTSKLNDAYRTLKDPIARTQYLLRLEGVELEEQSKAATEEARSTGKVKKQVVPPDLLEDVFELNMQLEELREQKKLAEDDPALLEEIGKQKLSLEAKQDELLHELKTCWKEWDAAPDGDDAARAKVRDRMVDLLNRRNYIRNLVRDVNEVLDM
jgi:molecular chaperone HscB